MALVPIIYTSLLIFTSLLLFVIMVSYISFRANKKTAPLAEPNLISYNSFETRPANLNYNNLSVQPVAVQYRKPIEYPVLNQADGQARRSSRNSLPISLQNERVNDFQEAQIKRNVKDEAYNKFQQPKRLNQKPAFSRNRIVIMNDSQQFNSASLKTEFDYTYDPARSENSVTEKNLFNFYSDREDLDLVMLSSRQR